ncbi:MAG: biotin/lipoyl-binding protein [Chromatiaceae bacterium]|nr:biotin/lipoyl-binding protein [Chromatiaceae bacterium]MCP5439604.1 biotin/lipoyl-binding protein [Chromatiaceae bacterium]
MIEDKHVQQKARRPRWWLPPLILLLAGAAAAALIASKPKPKPVTVAERAWLVAAETVAARRYRPGVTLYGRIESLWSSQLTAGVAADVREVAVVEGDRVAKGQVLVRLDDRDARLQLLQREAELRQAEARIAAEQLRHEANLETLPRERQLLALTRGEVARLQDLVTKKVGAQSQLDTARQAAEKQAIALSARQQAVDEHPSRLAEVEGVLARAAALRDQAILEVERCEVRAPFNGRIVEVMVSPGRRTRVGDPLVDLFDTDALVLRAQLPARHLPVVRAARAAGEPLIVHGEIDGVSISGELRSLAGEATSGTGGVDGLFTVTTGADEVSQGRFVRLELALPETGGLIALPHEALYGTDRIYTIDEQSRMRPQRVERVGEWRDPDGDIRVLVRAVDLPDGARVVTTQLPAALDGLLVRVAGEG